MISLTPNSTPVDVNDVREILALINDRDAAAKRLEELSEAADKATAAVDEQRKLSKQLEAASADLETRSEQVTAAAAKFDAYNKTRGDELATMAAALNDRVREFETREAESLQSLATREELVGNRERKVKQREDAVTEREQKAAAMASTYEQKLAALRSLAS